MFKIAENDVLDGTKGVCLRCGCVQDGCEPDARNYLCEDCGCSEVFGVEEALIMGEIEIVVEGEEDE